MPSIHLPLFSAYSSGDVAAIVLGLLLGLVLVMNVVFIVYMKLMKPNPKFEKYTDSTSTVGIVTVDIANSTA